MLRFKEMYLFEEYKDFYLCIMVHRFINKLVDADRQLVARCFVSRPSLKSWFAASHAFNPATL